MSSNACEAAAAAVWIELLGGNSCLASAMQTPSASSEACLLARTPSTRTMAVEHETPVPAEEQFGIGASLSPRVKVGRWCHERIFFSLRRLHSASFRYRLALARNRIDHAASKAGVKLELKFGACGSPSGASWYLTGSTSRSRREASSRSSAPMVLARPPR